ncbi:protein MFI-like [Brachyistius frenatus]|uniref:protein MFI-like n=1 Tax=Brachyistius frenatus TaxID=100188 RepID=UPI0037E85305
MSLKKVEPQRAATIIQKAWRRHMCRNIFMHLKELISLCSQLDPQKSLKTVNPRETELLDAAAGVFIRFRLGGITFPPSIYYKIFTHQPITDVCASSPRDYFRLGLKRPVVRKTFSNWALMQDDKQGWYQRTDNNSWRLFCNKVVFLVESTEIGKNKKVDFHFSQLQRKHDVDKWRKRRKIEWMKQMYNQGRLQDHPEDSDVETMMEDATQEVIDAIEEKGDDAILEWELDELLAWTNTLNFEEYMRTWRRLACSEFLS